MIQEIIIEDAIDKAWKKAVNWERFVNEGLCYDGTSNVKYEFKKMCKKYGRSYLDYLDAAYIAKDTMTDEEFCSVNNVDSKYFVKNIKP